MNKKIILYISIFTLLVLGVGCLSPSLFTSRATPTPVTMAPTATVVPPTVPAADPSADPSAITPMPPEKEIAAANELENQMITVYEAVSPAVVNITVRGYVYDMYMRAVPQEGGGSGFLYDDQGHIVTNYHVVQNADELMVMFADEQVYEAKIVGIDPSNDLAVIRVDVEDGLPTPMDLGDSDQLRVGQFVLAIGNPFGVGQTLTTGVISALGRIIESPDPEGTRFIGEAIQTDAAINPGNSGGPLLDLNGRVIGVNSQIISPSQASAGIGFAVSSNTVRRVVPELIARGYYPHPWLGTYMISLSPAASEVFREAGMDLPVDHGMLVTEAVEGGPADEAGIQGGDRMVRIGRYQIALGGDVIVAIDDVPINNYQDLNVYLETQTVVGDTVQVTVLRAGEELTVPVTLGERPQTP